MKLSIVLPTISGREDSLARAIASYEDTLDCDYELIIVRDESTWPRACNVGYAESKGDIILFTADDLEAMPGWFDDIPLFLSARDELPAPRVFDYSPTGKWANAEDGADGALTHFTRIPIMTRSQWERIGTWPEIIYYADLWVSEKARSIGIETRMVHSFSFVHHWSGVGRVDSQENLDQSRQELARLREQFA